MSPVYKFSNVGGFLTKNLYTSALAGNTAVVNDKGSMYPLGVFTLASAQATIEFTNIPQTYTHLEIRGLSKNTAGSGYILVEYNGDTSTSKYTWHSLSGDGASPGTGASATGTFSGNPITQTQGGGTSIFSSVIISILDYRNTNKNTTMRAISGFDNNGSGTIGLTSGLFVDTNPITSIKLKWSGNNFAANSSFALYGIQA